MPIDYIELLDDSHCLEVLNAIAKERIRQNDKWGEQNHSPETWLTILMEEVGEASHAALEHSFGTTSLIHYRNEIIHVAAVAIAALESYERNEAQHPSP